MTHHDMVAALPHCSLNLNSALVHSVEQTAHETVLSFLRMGSTDKAEHCSKMPHITEVQFQPIEISGIDHVAAKVNTNITISHPYPVHVDPQSGHKYLILDQDYPGFFKNERFKCTTQELKDSQLYDCVDHIKKVFLDHHVLYKEHKVQQFLPKGRVNPQYDHSNPDRIIFTISAGSQLREEILKYAVKANGDVEYGPCNPALKELQVDLNNSTDMFEFLSRAHFFK